MPKKLSIDRHIGRNRNNDGCLIVHRDNNEIQMRGLNRKVRKTLYTDKCGTMIFTGDWAKYKNQDCRIVYMGGRFVVQLENRQQICFNRINFDELIITKRIKDYENELK